MSKTHGAWARERIEARIIAVKSLADPADGFGEGRFEKVWPVDHSGVFRKSSGGGTTPRGHTLLPKERAVKRAPPAPRDTFDENFC